MARPRRDGSPSKPTLKKNLTDMFCRKARAPGPSPLSVWDLKERGLVLRIQPSGHRAFKVVYSLGGRPRWYHVGNVPLSDARRIAIRIRLAVAEGRDPASEKKSE